MAEGCVRLREVAYTLRKVAYMLRKIACMSRKVAYMLRKVASLRKTVVKIWCLCLSCGRGFCACVSPLRWRHVLASDLWESILCLRPDLVLASRTLGERLVLASRSCACV